MNFYKSNIHSADFWLSADAVIHCKSYYSPVLSSIFDHWMQMW